MAQVGETFERSAVCQDEKTSKSVSSLIIEDAATRKDDGDPESSSQAVGPSLPYIKAESGEILRLSRHCRPQKPSENERSAREVASLEYDVARGGGIYREVEEFKNLTQNVDQRSPHFQ
jgi:hypothetical protein